MAHVEGQQHPIAIYFWIWGLLFVLSTFSYMVDYLDFQGLLRWTLIITFMLAKAGLIVAVFMHMMWERMAIMCAILIPPMVIILLTLLMAAEANYVFFTRLFFFGAAPEMAPVLHH